MSVINSQPLIGASGNQGYFLDRSLRFRSSASAYLNRTPASTGNRRTWTWSAWVKRGTISSSFQNLFGAYDNSSASDSSYFGIGFDANALAIGVWSQNFRVTSAVYRDPSSWYHIVLALDTTQATANNRVRLYVNGSEVTAFSTTNNPALNADLGINANQPHNIARQNYTSGSGPYPFDGYMTEINFIDGQALTPSSFGETSASTGVWIPKKYTGTYGTNGFYLDFKDNSALTTSSNAGLGKDNSGNGNYWTTNNISITSGVTYDSMTDVPTLTSPTAANYCVWNPVNNNNTNTITNGNLNASNNGGTYATMSLPSGKWYWEYFWASGTAIAMGISPTNRNIYFSNVGSGAVSYFNDGQKSIDGTNSAYGASYTTSDVIGVALDITGGTITFYKNNVSQGAISLPAGISEWVASVWSRSGTVSVNANFGQQPFTYTPPTGFVALNTFNLPTPTIGATASSQANDYFDATTYTATGTTQAVVNSGGMQPDFVWIKPRSIVATNLLFDSIRGVTKYLESNSTNAETTDTTNFFNSFNSNGFSQGTGNYANGTTVVAWQWRASNATGVTNTAGSITSTVSANTTAGFSIVTYTGNGTAGATIGHGLGVTPKFIIVKQRNATNSWNCYHADIGNTKAIALNSTATPDTSANYWNNTSPTSSLITISTNVGVGGYNNANGGTYVAYCFAEVAGYSKFGSYTGNGSADGPFVFCGFRPKYIMIKRTSDAESWVIQDTSRDQYNLTINKLYANASGAEDPGNSYGTMDILSNGFKLRASHPIQNASGSTYIYMAFCESPFKYSVAR